MSITKPALNTSSWYSTLAKKAVLWGAIALSAATGRMYVRADEPEKPVEEMTQQEFEAKRKAKAEQMRRDEEAAEQAEHDRILQELKQEIADAEAEKKAEEARKISEAQDAKTKARVGSLLSGVNTQLPASKLDHSHFEIHGDYDFKNKGFSGGAELKFGLGKGFFGYVQLDGLKRNEKSGNAEGDRQAFGAYLGLTSDDFAVTLNNSYDKLTLSDDFTNSEDITPTLTSTTTSSTDESDSELLQSLKVSYHVDDIFNIGLMGTRMVGREKNDTHVVANTAGTVPTPSGDVLVDETAEVDANARTNRREYHGQAFLEGKFGKHFALHGRFTFVENNIETLLNGSKIIDEKERRVQGLIRARLANDWAHLVLDAGYQKMLDGPEKHHNSHPLWTVDLAIQPHDQFIVQASGWYDENRQYGMSTALALSQKPFSNSALADLAREAEALRDIKNDASLTARQRAYFARLLPEHFIKRNDGAVFRFSIDGDGTDHHLYSGDAAISTSALIKGTSVHLGYTGGRGYKSWFGKVNVELSDTFTIYGFGQHEQDSITDTSSTAVGAGISVDFGPSESDK